MQHTNSLLTRLRSLNYNPWTGSISGPGWNVYTTDGYPILQRGRLKIAAHRAAYLLMTGYLPHIVDHINRDRSDMRWRNLRASCPSANNRNKSTATHPIARLSQRRAPIRHTVKLRGTFDAEAYETALAAWRAQWKPNGQPLRNSPLPPQMDDFTTFLRRTTCPKARKRASKRQTRQDRPGHPEPV